MSSDTFGDVATALGAVATAGLLVAALLAGRTAQRQLRQAVQGVQGQIRTQRDIEARRRTLDLQSTLYSREFVEMSATLQGVVRRYESDEKAGEAMWHRMTDYHRGVVIAVLNFYDLVATEYNAGDVLDTDIADRNLAYSAYIMWRYAQPFIIVRRRENPAYFYEWERFVTEHGLRVWTAAQPPSAATPPPSAPPPPAPPSPAQATDRRTTVVRVTPTRGEDIHLPGPSILPFLAAIAITLIVIGTTINLLLSLAGAALLLVVTIRWIADTRRAIDDLPLEHPEPH